MSLRQLCPRHGVILSLAKKPLVIHRTCIRSVSSKASPADHCLELVRRTDHEHFLTNLLLPNIIRTHSFAIRALSSEVSGVRDSVSDKTLGLVRLQFWRDTIGWYRVIKKGFYIIQFYTNVLCFVSWETFKNLF